MKGRATPEGTERYAREHPAAEGYYRKAHGWTVSSLGMGTYLGENDAPARQAYQTSVAKCLEGGVNLLDTAINYRDQLSERDVGAALARFGRRDEVVVTTKGGFLTLDAEMKEEPRGYVQRTYVDTGLAPADQIARGSHCMAPQYLENQLQRSLHNLGLETVDVYFVHNPETQLNGGIARTEFDQRCRRAFEQLEAEADAGRIQTYGVATWDGFRVGPEAPNHLSLERLLELAEEAHSNAGGKTRRHRFGAIELPINIAMVEALTQDTQEWEGDEVPLVGAAAEADLMVLASASLLQARLVGRLPPFVRQVLDAPDDVVAAVEFTRSIPGVTCALVGMGDPSHAAANVGAMTKRSPRPEALAAFFAAENA